MAKTKEEKKQSKNVHEITIKIEGEEWKKALDKAFNDKKRDTVVDGFRKGKVPRDVYEKHYGKESLFIPAADYVLQDAYMKVMEENKLVPVVQPDVNLGGIDEDGVEFVFKIITKPEVNVKKYKGLKIEKEKVEVTKEEIEHELSHVLEKYTELVTKDGKVESGNVAVIDFEGFKDGVAFDGGKGENYPLEIGSNTFIPGFEEQLIGLKAGDEKDIKVTFPEDYASEELKGQEAVFKIKVHEVKTKELPEMDEEFFKDLGYEGVETEEQLKDLVKADLEAKQEYELENKYVDDLLEEAAKHTVVDLPEELVHEEIHRMMHQYEENLKMQGITLDMFYQFTNSSEEDLEKQMHPEAEKRVKYRFMLEEIATLEKVEVTDEEANKEAEDLAKKYNTTKEELLNQIGGLDALKYEVEMQKVIEILKK